MTSGKLGTIRRLSNLVTPRGTPMVAWWYGRLLPNNRDRTQPCVEVLFREVDDHGEIGDAAWTESVNISALGQVPLGSVWRQGHDAGVIPLLKRRYEVDFSPGGWELVRALRQDLPGRYPIPPFAHPLLKGFSRPTVDSWLIRFQTRKDGHLIIPAIEYFLRTYGKSSELHRILLTYPWPEAARRLFAASQPRGNESHAPERWVIHLGAHLQIEDALFLGHVLHDQHTQALAKGLWSQIAHAPREGIHLRVEPWHQGWGRVEVLGKELGNGGFLALRITGMTPPPHPLVEVVRMHREASRPGASDAGNVHLIRHHADTEEEMPLLNEQPPDHGMGYIEIEDPAFQWLEQAPNIHISHKNEANQNNRPTLVDHEVGSLSAGDAAGSPRGVGKLAAHPPTVLEGRGTLRDMWDTFLHLREHHPDRILGVGWMDWDGTIHAGEEPHLCPFPPSNEPGGPSTWLLVGEHPPRQRGLLLIWVRTHKGAAVIMEIERERDPRNEGQEKDAYKGLAVLLGDDVGKVLCWLKGLAAILPARRGIIPRRLSNCPTLAATFKHRRSEVASMRENTAWLALGKVRCV